MHTTENPSQVQTVSGRLAPAYVPQNPRHEPPPCPPQAVIPARQIEYSSSSSSEEDQEEAPCTLDSSSSSDSSLFEQLGFPSSASELRFPNLDQFRRRSQPASSVDGHQQEQVCDAAESPEVSESRGKLCSAGQDGEVPVVQSASRDVTREQNTDIQDSSPKSAKDPRRPERSSWRARQQRRQSRQTSLATLRQSEASGSSTSESLERNAQGDRLDTEESNDSSHLVRDLERRRKVPEAVLQRIESSDV